MVAAWMRALTVVGPSIASGSQVCRGNCALFPAAPPRMRSPASVIRLGSLAVTEAIELAERKGTFESALGGAKVNPAQDQLIPPALQTWPG